MRKATTTQYVAAVKLAVVLTVASLAITGWAAGAPREQAPTVAPTGKQAGPTLAGTANDFVRAETAARAASGGASPEGSAYFGNTQATQQQRSAEHRNELALIIAGTYEEGETHFTTGLEFERRLSHRFGLGGAAEYLVDGSWVFVFPVYFHPVGGFKALTGPGVEHTTEENSFLWRVGAAYSFEFAERYSVTPGLEVDFVGREEALVFGVNFGISF